MAYVISGVNPRSGLRGESLGAVDVLSADAALKAAQMAWDTRAAALRAAAKTMASLTGKTAAQVEAEIVKQIGARPAPVSTASRAATTVIDPLARARATKTVKTASGTQVVIASSGSAPDPSGSGGGGNTMLYVGGAAAALALILALRR